MSIKERARKEFLEYNISITDVYSARWSYRDLIPEKNRLEVYNICRRAEWGAITPLDAIMQIQELALLNKS